MLSSNVLSTHFISRKIYSLFRPIHVSLITHHTASIPSDTPSAHSAHPKPSLLTPASLDGPGPITPLTDPMIRPHIPARVTVSLDDLEGSTVTPVTPPPTFMGKSTSCNGLHAVTGRTLTHEQYRLSSYLADNLQFLIYLSPWYQTWISIR